MNLKKEWDAHIKALEDARQRLEETLTLVPDAGTGKKCRQAVERAWQKVIDTSDKIEELLSSSLQPLPIKFPWQDAEFRQTWQMYKDYLQEQHHVVMESRMEAMRLKLLLKFTGDNRENAIAAIEFYMSCGTSNIFAVNFKNEKQDEKQDGTKRSTVTIS